jgi:hypothetical protein
MSTLQFDAVEVKSIFKLLAIDNLARELIKHRGCKFKPSDLKDLKKIYGSFEDLKLLQLKLMEANLPTGKIIKEVI